GMIAATRRDEAEAETRIAPGAVPRRRPEDGGRGQPHEPCRDLDSEDDRERHGGDAYQTARRATPDQGQHRSREDATSCRWEGEGRAAGMFSLAMPRNTRSPASAHTSNCRS